MSDSKRQSLIVIAVSMIAIAGILLYFSLSQPKIYIDDSNTTISSTEAEQQASQPVTSKNNTVRTQNTTHPNVVSFPININTCSFEDLLAVDGIGESKASAIIEYREVIGEYKSVEEIKNIKGIGDGVYAQISPYLCV